jgi:hypothetical protein
MKGAYVTTPKFRPALGPSHNDATMLGLQIFFSAYKPRVGRVMYSRNSKGAPVGDSRCDGHKIDVPLRDHARGHPQKGANHQSTRRR